MFESKSEMMKRIVVLEIEVGSLRSQCKYMWEARQMILTLADHLGMKFEHQATIPEKQVLVKKSKKSLTPSPYYGMVDERPTFNKVL